MGTASLDLLRALRDAVGHDHVLDSPDTMAGYVTDWTGRFRGSAPAVVRPADTGEVAEVLRACERHGATVVVQGGNTGLVGGGVPLHGEVLLSTRRLCGLGPVDAITGQVTVGAGATLAQLQAHAALAGKRFAVDLGARDTATVGGMTATNAGGMHVIAHGTMRSQVVGLEAVLADGSVVSHLGGLLKDNTGYDLAALLCGSEGTLGVITAVRVRLLGAVPRPVVVVVGHDHLDSLIALVVRLRDDTSVLEAAEFVLADGVAMVQRQLGLEAPAPFHRDASVLLELSGGSDALELLDAMIPDGADVVVALDDPTGAARLWRIREAHPEAVNALGPPVKLDVSLPLPGISAFLGDLRPLLEALACESVVFGHLGDGNLHVNVLREGSNAIRAHMIEDAVLRLVVVHHGSISAEHGIGTAKREWLHLARSPAEIAAFRAIKAALDPSAMLNPHCLLPASGPTTSALDSAM